MSFPPSPHTPLQHVRELLEFAYLMSLDRSKWPRCLLWHVWLSGLSGIGQRDPWWILVVLGLLLITGDAADIALEMPEHPNVWTDGSREDFSSIGGFEVAGAVYLPASELAFDGLVW